MSERVGSVELDLALVACMVAATFNAAYCIRVHGIVDGFLPFVAAAVSFGTILGLISYG